MNHIDAAREQLRATLYLRAPEQLQAIDDGSAADTFFMTDLHLDGLERVAHAAAECAPGRWTAFWLGWWRYAIAAPTQAIASYVEQPLARHIALADPRTVLALVAEVRSYRQLDVRPETDAQRTISRDVLDALGRAQGALDAARHAAVARTPRGTTVTLARRAGSARQPTAAACRPGPLRIAGGASHARPNLLQPATPNPPASTHTGTLEGNPRCGLRHC